MRQLKCVFMQNCKHKMIVCGDFNDSPTSFAYGTLSKGLKDAFIESGSGLGNTYIGPFPSLRIDYILYDKSFDSYNYKSINTNYSDHKLIETLLIKN